MAVTLEEISGWLDNLEVKHKLDSEEKKILSGVGDGDTNKSLVFELEEDGGMFQAYMNLLDEEFNVLKIKDHEHKALVLQHILNLNYGTKFGTWEFDPRDGEIRLAIEIPLEDAKMTQKQLKRIFNYFLKDGQKAFDEILQIMKTGEIPEEDDDEMAAMLLQMLQELKDDLESKTSSDEDPSGI